MDLQDQLKALFPDRNPEETQENTGKENEIWIQQEPLLCAFEKRHGKATTIVKGYTGSTSDFKILAREIKTELGTGGTVKNEQIIIQGDYRSEIMQILKEYGFKVKRTGG